MQVRFDAGLTSEEYVKQKGWLAASLPFCPFHPKGGCGFARHTPYERVDPPGCLIARWYCRPAHRTVSLLPDFLCSRLTGVLADAEAVVVAAETARSREVASETVRPDIELPGALRWMRRRVQLVHAGLAAAIGLLPTVLAGCKPTVTSVRSALRAEVALVRLRLELAPYLAVLPPPLGFGPRRVRWSRPASPFQQETGPDPPAGRG